MEGGVHRWVLAEEVAVWLVGWVRGCGAERVVVLTPVVTPVSLYKGDTHPATLQRNQELLGVLGAVERLPVVNCRGAVITLG